MQRLGAFGVAAGLAALALAASTAMAAPPHVITPAALGANTFSESFQRLDWGEDDPPGRAPHRWRSVLGYGGENSEYNRTQSRDDIYVDPDFPGVTPGGELGPKALGLNPFSVTPGAGLAITASPTPAALRPLLFGRPYMSGMLTTRFSFQQTYGYFEVRAQLPRGQGLWPAFWMLPVPGGGSPAGTELDVFEQLGRQPHAVFCTLHYQGRTWFWWPKMKYWEKRVPTAFDVTAGFHTYGVAWGRDEITWYVDRREVCRQPTPEGMDQPMYLLLDLAVGGPWSGSPNATTRFPASMVVSGVNVWRLKGG